MKTNSLLSEESWNEAATSFPAMYGNFGQSFERPSERHHSEGNHMGSSNGTFARKIRGQSSATNSRPTSPELTDWLAAQLRNLSTKEVALLSETSERTAENAKLGKCAFNMASLVAMCRNSPEFAAAYAEYVGLIMPGEAEFAGALTNAFNAFQRRKA